VGIGFDDGAWIASAFNAAIMFIGPFTVYLGALLGTRRTLLVSAAMFIVVFCSTSVSPHLQLVDFLACDRRPDFRNFLSPDPNLCPAQHPPPLSCVHGSTLRHLRRRGRQFCAFSLWFLPGASFVGMDVLDLGSHHARDDGMHLFRNTRVTEATKLSNCAELQLGFSTPVLVSPWSSPRSIRDSGSTGGAQECSQLCLSVEHSCLICSLVRRLRSPNPLVDLPYLRKWNTNLLAVGLFAFRFVLLATILIIPQSLACAVLTRLKSAQQSFGQHSQSSSWRFLAPFFLTEASTHVCSWPSVLPSIAFACLINANFTSTWTAENYFRTELLMAVGQSLAFMGLVSSLILQAIFSGALEVPQRALTFSAFFHTIRLFGGQIGVAVMGRFHSRARETAFEPAGTPGTEGRLD